MADVRIAFYPDPLGPSSDGFGEILHSDACQQLVGDVAQEIAERANANSGLDSFRASTVKAGTRWIGFASTTDKASVIAESEDKALTGAIL